MSHQSEVALGCTPQNRNFVFKCHLWRLKAEASGPREATVKALGRRCPKEIIIIHLDRLRLLALYGGVLV
jgi:hypothetical protein